MTRLMIRLPDDLKAFVESQARLNASSQNSEIVRCIRERMKAIGPVGTAIPPGLRSTNPQQETSDERVAG